MGTAKYDKASQGIDINFKGTGSGTQPQTSKSLIIKFYFLNTSYRIIDQYH